MVQEARCSIQRHDQSRSFPRIESRHRCRVHERAARSSTREDAAIVKRCGRAQDLSGKRVPRRTNGASAVPEPNEQVRVAKRRQLCRKAPAPCSHQGRTDAAQRRGRRSATRPTRTRVSRTRAVEDASPWSLWRITQRCAALGRQVPRQPPRIRWRTLRAREDHRRRAGKRVSRASRGDREDAPPRCLRGARP